MSATHTPGPWLRDGTTVFALNSQGTNRTCFNVANGGEIWRPHDRASIKVERTPPEEHEANARLIAAAPELLSALDELVDALTAGYVPQKDGSMLKEARALIARAGGRL